MFVNSQPAKHHNEGENGQIQWLNTLNVHIYDISLNTSSSTIGITFFIACIIMPAVIEYLYFTVKRKDKTPQNANSDKQESGILFQLIAGWCALHRTLLSYGFAYSFITIITNFSNNLKLQQSISSTFYLQLVLLFLGCGSIIVTYLLSFCILNLPLEVPKLPWNSYSTQKGYLCKELFKMIIIVQDYFLQIFDVNSNKVILAVYYSCIFIFLLITLYSRPIYYDSKVNRFSQYLTIVTLFVSLISTARAIVDIELLKILFFSPLLIYAIASLIMKFNERKIDQIVKTMVEGKKNIELSHSFSAIQQLVQLLAKIQSDPAFESVIDSNQDHIELTTEEKQKLNNIHCVHTLNCISMSCICRHYEFICWDQFKINYQEIAEDMNRPIIQKALNNPLESNQNLGKVNYDNNKQQTKTIQANNSNSIKQIESSEIQIKFILGQSKTENYSINEEPIISGSQNSIIGQHNFINEEQQEAIKLIDIFMFENNNAYQINSAKFRNFENIYTKKQMINEILSRNFKNSSEARLYYYHSLVCEVLENFYKSQARLSSKNYDDRGNKSHNHNEYISSNLFELKFIMASFQIKYLGKPFLTIKNLIQNSQQNKDRPNGAFAEIQFKICEFLIMKNIVSTLNFDPTSVVDFENFIKFNEKNQTKDQLYDDTAQDILDFWKIFNGVAPDIDEFFKKGREISGSISEILNHFKNSDEKQENCGIERILLKIYFHQQLMNDFQTAISLQATINDKQIKKKHVQTQGKYKNENNNSSKFIIDESIARSQNSSKIDNQEHLKGLCIVSLTSLDFEQIEILFANKDLAEIYGTSDKSLDGLNIKTLMPTNIRQYHSEFVSRFFKSNHQSLLSRDRITFLKDNKGFLKPIKLKIEFNYDLKYKYVFTAQIQPLSTFYSGNALKNGAQVQVSDSMIIITDYNFNIIDISQNVLSIAGFEDRIDEWETSMDQKGRPYTIEDFIPEILTLFNQKSKQNQSQTPNISFQNKLVNFSKYSTRDRQIVINQSFPAILNCFEESLTANSDNQYIFIVTPLSKHPDADSYINKNEKFEVSMKNKIISKTEFALSMNSNGQVIKSNKDNKLNFDNQNDISQDEYEGQNDQSMSSIASSQKSDSKIGDSAYIVQNLLFKDNSPKIMITTTYILCLMILAFLGVNVFDITVFLNKHSLILPRIESFQFSTQRYLLFQNLILEVMMIHQLSQSDLNESENQMKLFDLYNETFMIDLEQARSLTSNIDLNNIKYGSFEQYIVDITFLSDVRKTYTKKVTLKHMNSLLIQHLETLSISSIVNQKPPLNITSYPFIKQPIKVAPTETEKILYFLQQNGLNRMEESSYKQQIESEENTLLLSKQSRVDIATATYVSVAVLAGILLFLTPLFIQLFNRRYRVLHYFMLLSESSIIKAQQDASIYQKKLFSINNQDFKGNYFDTKPEKQLIKSQKSSQQEETKKQKIIFGLGKNDKKNKQKEDYLIMIQEEKSENSCSSSRSSSNLVELQKQKSEIKDKDVNLEEKIEELTLRNQRKQIVIDQLQKTQIQDKVKIFGIIILLIGTLNSIFLISSSYSNSVLLKNEVSISEINIFFNRENCATNLIQFMRKQIIRNTTVMTRNYIDKVQYIQTSAVAIYLSKCLIIENQYAQGLISIPDYLSEAQTTIQNLENNQFCNSTFLERNPIKANQCNEAMDGILKHGVGAAMSQLLNLINKLQISFNNNPSLRTSEQISKNINSQKLLDIVELTIMYLKIGFVKTQDAVISSVQNYFAQTRTFYILLVGIFISVTVLIFIVGGILLFLRIKSRILEAQNILVLIPFGDLTQTDRISIERYLSS